jgi:prolyl-tRNA synthetase
MSIAPFQVVICALDMREEQVTALAEKLHDQLEAAGIDVIYDDRDARPGFKFKDAELVGFPIRVTVGKKGLADGTVDIQLRRTGQAQKVNPDQVVPVVQDLVETALKTDCARRTS